jgi:predicted 3-demethylubiquinone-9 3-methyltransferase (glyoxalase superfamily)
MQKITPCIWFDNQVEEAIAFYTSIFPESKVLQISHYPEGTPELAGKVLTATFRLSGQEFIALNGGPMFKFTEAVSFSVDCKTQDEVDYYWNKLSEGGEESMCGWLKDKFGLSWQVVPTALGSLIGNLDPEKAQRVIHAMLKMRKIDIETLKQAAK